ncbi:hypothetical protein [Aureimonas sp. AU4]|uniref:hypothetical protein n=1 Tax=Aureimonas sp. AU4 TaxID=1638163 RepID=UPI000785029B|nr:hypothetical protein [Aureimonas sp. AU4]
MAGAAAAADAGTIEAELFDGTILEFPAGTSDEVIRRVAREQTQARRAAAPAPQAPAGQPAPSQPWQGGVPVGGVGSVAPTPREDNIVDTIMGMGTERTVADHATGLVRSGAEGFNRGLAGVIGLPVDAANAAPMLANLLPGVKGVGPISDRPLGGSQSIRDMGETVAAVFGVEPYQPQNAAERISGRVGQEVGATTAFLAGPVAAGARLGAASSRALPAPLRTFVEPAAVAPGQLVRREGTLAMGAGTGAGVANEIAGNPQEGDNLASDFTGSLVGALATGGISAAGGAVGNLFSAARGTSAYVDDVVGEAVADQLINSSTRMGAQAAETGTLDTSGLVADLRRPAPVEDAIPGYRANIADRTRDPGLATFAFNTDGARPGAAAARRTANEGAVNRQMEAMAPTGDPGQFRAAVQASVDQRIADADRTAEDATAAIEAAQQRLAPTVPYAEARGATVRSGIRNAERTARAGERQAWSSISGEVDPAPLAESFREVGTDLPLARRAVVGDMGPMLGIPAQLAGREAPADLQEITSLSSALSTARRNALSGPQPDRNRADVLQTYIDGLNGFLDDAVGGETAGQLATARGVSRNVNERFARPGDPLAGALATREGRPVQPDSAVARTFVQPDAGQASNIDRLLAETDLGSQAQGVRAAIRDEILADVGKRGLLGKPDHVEGYLRSYGRVFDRFPDLRGELMDAAATGRTADTARRTAETMRRDLTTPGRSAEGSYLRYGDERTIDAIRTVTNASEPRQAARQLVEAAGGTPEARRNAQAALWADIRQTGRMQAEGMTGETRWNGKKLRDFLADPKRSAVAEELYADAPDELAAIREVFGALASAEGSGRARAAGTSGTGQVLTGKYDPSLSAASIASRMRSVNRGQLSPGIAVIDVLSTFLRNRSKQVQARAIDTIAASVVNEPGMAADLLERFNPADRAARRRRLTQRYGARATQVLNVLDEVEDQDGNGETVGAIMRAPS